MINKNRYFIKLFGSYVIVILILSVLLLLISFRKVEDHYIDTLTNDLVHLNYAIEGQVQKFYCKSQYAELDNYVKELGKRISTRITVIDTGGNVLADSEKDPALMENHGHRGEIRDAYNGAVGRFIRFSATMKKTMLYVATPIKVNNEIVAVVRTSLYLSDVEELLQTVLIRIINITFILIIVVLIGVLIYSNTMYRPVKELVEASNKISQGDFNVRVKINRKSVFSYLADAFNLMTAKLKDSFSEISLQRDQLRAIISAVPSGLFVIDKDGKILLYNQSSSILSGKNEISNKYFWEVIDDKQFVNLIRKTKKTSRDTTEEITINEKTYLCSISQIPANEETVLILHDITDLKNLQIYKKDFVANVSHELRTPLTAIKGFVETLQDEFTADSKRYLDIIDRHTDRLINIVNDLLLLNEIEDTTRLEIEKIEPKRIRDDLSKLFEEKLKNKNLKIIWDIPESISAFVADPFKLEQVFINLLDNAIKYTETGHIKVRFYQEGADILIDIEDTGIGIPEEQQPRIFERFYTVDKSRSRRLGGTGLGLSIAKHIVLLHNGSITVSSRPGKGTTFTIRLPQDQRRKTSSLF